MRIHKLSGRPLLALPLGQAEGNKLLRWIVAIMTYVLAIAIVIIIGATHITGRWDAALNNQLTIEVAATPTTDNDDNKVAPLAVRVTQVKNILDQNTAVLDAKDVPETELRSLLTPWLGDSALLTDIPLPALLEITFAPGKPIDVEALTKQLTDKVPGVNVIAHSSWAQAIKRLAQIAIMIAYSLLTLVSLAAIACITFAARARLAIHSAEVEMLHILGATDRYVANQFQRQAFITTWQGLLLGMLLILLTAAGAYGYFRPMTLGAVHDTWASLAITPQEYWLIVGLPLGLLVAATLAARWSVLGALRKLP